MRYILIAMIMSVALLISSCGNGEATSSSSDVGERQEIAMSTAQHELKIKLEIGDRSFDAILEDNPSTREFISRLPLDVDMTELNGNEKYFVLDRRLPTNDVNVGSIRAGDLMLFSGNYFVLFYKSFSTSYQYTRLGRIENPADLVDAVGRGNVHVRID